MLVFVFFQNWNCQIVADSEWDLGRELEKQSAFSWGPIVGPDWEVVGSGEEPTMLEEEGGRVVTPSAYKLFMVLRYPILLIA